MMESMGRAWKIKKKENSFSGGIETEISSICFFRMLDLLIFHAKIHKKR